jgi:hypothetical protein
VSESSFPNALTRRAQIEELTLKCAGSTQLRLLFNEPFLLQTSYYRLRGPALPYDREFNTLTALAGVNFTPRVALLAFDLFDQQLELIL